MQLNESVDYLWMHGFAVFWTGAQLNGDELFKGLAQKEDLISDLASSMENRV